MNDDGRIVQVEIFGQQYPIRTTLQDEEYVKRIARYVDGKMREIHQSMRPDSSTKVAILTALNIADELFSERGEQDRTLADYRSKMNHYIEELDKKLRDDSE